MNILQVEPILSLEIVDRIALRAPIRDPSDVIKYLGELAVCYPVERIYAIFLTGNLRPIAYMSGGTGNHHRCLVDVRGIIASALMLNAEAIILTHTHPFLSSQPHTPSEKDIETTKKLQEVLSFFNMTLLDSFILEHCAENQEKLSLTSILKWIKNTESENSDTVSEQEVAHQ